MKKKARRKTPSSRGKTLAKRGAVIAALVVVFGGGALTVIRFMHSGSSEAPKKLVETVHLQLVPPPPPPPPPPPQPVVKPPEPQKFLEQPKVAEKPAEKPPDAPKPALSTDLKGGGPDNFGLAGSGQGATVGGSGGQDFGKFGWYASIIQTQIQSLLQKDDKLRSGRYRVTLSIWLSADGKPDRVKLLNATGDASVDSEIEQQIAAMPALQQPPPRDMPQPVNLRIEGRPAG